MKKRVVGKKTRIEPDEIKQYVWLRIADGISSFQASFGKYAAWVLIAWQTRIAVQALSGKETFASLIAQISYNDASLFNILCFALGVSGIGYGLFMRRLLRKQIEKDGEHIKRLEKLLDPNRSSSNLTVRGKTNPSDE